MLSLPSLSHSDKRFDALQVLDLCLAASASSRIFKVIRERRGLVYTVASMQHCTVIVLLGYAYDPEALRVSGADRR
jgi:predicted Zn-dependent peptidase